MPKILLTFDVEEFDLPAEYGYDISKEAQLQTGHNGWLALQETLNNLHIPATLFVTGVFAENFREQITAAASVHEIGSHSYAHTSFDIKDLQQSRTLLKEITGQKIYGFRMPRFKTKLYTVRDIAAAGYAYDSSINPTLIPGRYNNLAKPRVPYHDNGVLQFPVSVTPNFRIPLFWLAFRNLPYTVYSKLVKRTLAKDGYVCLYFHPWEFIDIKTYKLPSYLRLQRGNEYLQRFRQLLSDLKNEGEFTTMADYMKTKFHLRTDGVWD